MKIRKAAGDDSLSNTIFVVGSKSDGAGYLAASEATGANVNVLHGTVDIGFDFSDVRLPTPVGPAVRVRNVAAECNALSANSTFCHLFHLHKILHTLINFCEQFNI